MLSQRMKELKPSPTLALAAKAKLLQSQGHDVVSLTVGEPDWPTYAAAKKAGQKAIEDNKTTYTPAAGIPQLKEAIAKLVAEQLNLPISPKQVTVGSGAKYIIFAALASVLDPGDEVIIPSPYWVSYPTMVELAGGVPQIINCGMEQEFKLTAAQLKKEINPRTKALLLNSPSNPTGAEYSRDELKELAQVLKEHPGIVILSDDIYNQLSFGQGGVSPHLLHVAPELFNRCISINGMSKAYAMTGWRIGWVVGPELLTEAMANFLSQTTGAPCSISQWASVAAINDCREDVVQSLAALTERKNFAVDKISSVPGMEVFAPQGAFYLWVNIGEWMQKSYKGKKLTDSKIVAEILLDDFKLAVVPGMEFGLDPYLRLSFAASYQDLERATERFQQFRQSLQI